MAKVASITTARLGQIVQRSPAPTQKEMLVVMTGLLFIENNGLLSQSQLNDAKRSIQALFLRASGEETMLRKLIRILRVNRDLRHAFSAISKISTRIGTSVELISRKINYLNQYVGRLNLTPDENSDFFAPFLSFTQQFQHKILLFNTHMDGYLALKEIEARRIHEFRIAHEASDRLRSRLSGKLGTETKGEVETTIRQEVLETFDYAEAQENRRDAQRNSRIKAEEINGLLLELKDMCRMAMNPDVREPTERASLNRPEYDDIFGLFRKALRRHRRLDKIKNFVVDYFKLYQRAYGMFTLDYNNFNKAVETIANNPDEYFDAKHEDKDIKVKTEKLTRIEGLIPFLERSGAIITEDMTTGFQQFSRQTSDIISTVPSRWEHIREDLLVSKVAAEAELSTRME